MSYYSAVVHRQPAFDRTLFPFGAFPTEQMSPALDELSLKFAIYSRSARFDALDVGCGDGLASAAALARGGHVMAVDPDHAALHTLLARVPPEQYRRLKVRVGALPELDFKFGRFSAVHVARVLHLLEPGGLQQSLRKFFRWLYPEGRLFISALSPSGAYWEPLHDEYTRRSVARDPWPGYFEDVSELMPGWHGGASAVHLLEEHVLLRELEAAGFIIEEISSYSLPWDGEQRCCAAVARAA